MRKESEWRRKSFIETNHSRNWYALFSQTCSRSFASCLTLMVLCLIHNLQFTLKWAQVQPSRKVLSPERKKENCSSVTSLPLLPLLPPSVSPLRTSCSIPNHSEQVSAPLEKPRKRERFALLITDQLKLLNFLSKLSSTLSLSPPDSFREKHFFRSFSLSLLSQIVILLSKY